MPINVYRLGSLKRKPIPTPVHDKPDLPVPAAEVAQELPGMDRRGRRRLRAVSRGTPTTDSGGVGPGDPSSDHRVADRGDAVGTVPMEGAD